MQTSNQRAAAIGSDRKAAAKQATIDAEIAKGIPPALAEQDYRKSPSGSGADLVSPSGVDSGKVLEGLAIAPKIRRAKMVPQFQQEPTTLEQPIFIPSHKAVERAVADLQAHGDVPVDEPEVVGQLSDIDVLTIDDFADLAFEDIDLQPGKFSTLPVMPIERVRGANAFNDAMISQGDFQLAAAALDGSFFYVAGSHKVFALLEHVFPATGYGTVGVVDPGDLQAEITYLTGQLRDEKAARQRDVAAMKADLDASDRLAEELQKKFDEADAKAMRLERMADPKRFVEPVLIVNPISVKGDIEAEIVVVEDLGRYRTEGCTVIRMKRSSTGQGNPSLSRYQSENLGKILLGRHHEELNSQGHSYDKARELDAANTEIRQLKSQLHAEEQLSRQAITPGR